MFIKRALPPLSTMGNGWAKMPVLFMMIGEESFFLCLP